MLSAQQGRGFDSHRLHRRRKMVWKILLFAFALYVGMNLIAILYIFHKERKEVELIINAIEEADKE